MATTFKTNLKPINRNDMGDSVWNIDKITAEEFQKMIDDGNVEIYNDQAEKDRIIGCDIYHCKNVPCYSGDDVILFHNPTTNKVSFYFDCWIRFVEEKFDIEKAIEQIVLRGECDVDFTTEDI